VPIAVGGGGNDYQYTNVGTDIDCWGTVLGGGIYRISLRISRSSVYSPKASLASKGEAGASYPSTYMHPVIGSFGTDLDLLLRDGQTTESTMSTDPVSGRVLRVDVTLHVVK
jgi:hypothetical protein